MSWIYVPISPIGAVITSIIVVLNAWFFKAVDAHSHSPSDTLLNFFPYAVSLWVIYGWIAKQTVTKN